jgi:hypothetical protein
VSLRMLNNLRLADLRLTTAQQRSTGQNLPSDLYNSGIQPRVRVPPAVHLTGYVKLKTKMLFHAKH